MRGLAFRFVQQVFFFPHVLVVPTGVPTDVVQAPIIIMGPLGFQEFGGARRLDRFQDRRACFSVGSAVRDRVGVLYSGIGVKHGQCDRVYGVVG